MFSKLARGFTLIELMIVVAIIGILAMIAVPDFTRMSNRSRTSEAKVNLGTAVHTAKSLFVENGWFDCAGGSDTCGWNLEGNEYRYNYYLNGATADFTSPKGTGCAPTKATAAIDTAARTLTFTAGSNVKAGVCDEWSINQDGLLSQVNDGT